MTRTARKVAQPSRSAASKRAPVRVAPQSKPPAAASGTVGDARRGPRHTLDDCWRDLHPTRIWPD